MNAKIYPGAASRFLLTAAAFVIVVAGMSAASTIIVPFLLAVFIAIIVAPVFHGLRLWMRSWLALLVMIVALVLISVVFVNIVGRSLNNFRTNLPKYQLDLDKHKDGLNAWLESKKLPKPTWAVGELFDTGAVIGYLRTAAGTLSGLLSKTFLILLVVIFILAESAALPARARAMPGMTEEAWESIELVVGDVRRYMAMKSLISLLTGALVFVWLLVLRVDFPVLLAVTAFGLNFIPNIGSFIAAIPAVLLALAQFGVMRAGVCAVGYVAINIGIGNILEPRVMGSGLGISPLVVLVSLIFWGWVLGPVGMLLSVPLTMIVKIALEATDSTRGIAVLMGSARSALIPEEAPDTSGDRDEAHGR